MRRGLFALAGAGAAMLAGAAAAQPGGLTAGPPPGVRQSGPPAALLYQMRAAPPPGDRLATGRDGAALFSNRCGYCHLTGGMGTNLVTKQRIAAGEPPSNGLLANRRDLTADYVQTVVRLGKGAMPHQTKVDVTDAELASIARYLGKADR